MRDCPDCGKRPVSECETVKFEMRTHPGEVDQAESVMYVHQEEDDPGLEIALDVLRLKVSR